MSLLRDGTSRDASVETGVTSCDAVSARETGEAAAGWRRVPVLTAGTAAASIALFVAGRRNAAVLAGLVAALGALRAASRRNRPRISHLQTEAAGGP